VLLLMDNMLLDLGALQKIYYDRTINRSVFSRLEKSSSNQQRVFGSANAKS